MSTRQFVTYYTTQAIVCLDGGPNLAPQRSTGGWNQFTITVGPGPHTLTLGATGGYVQFNRLSLCGKCPSL